MTGPGINSPLATYAFYSWLRRGVSTQIVRKDGEAGNVPRAVVDVHLGFNNDALSVDVPLELFGSGEVASFEVRSVVRTWPRADSPDAEPNYFPLVEFRDAELPWRLTPASASANGRLRPWLVLAVLRDDEATFKPATTAGALPSIVVADTASLPDLAQSWAWAHVQVSNSGALDAAALQALVTSQSGIITSRLLSARKLGGRTRYSAYVVPAFERGRLAGLRLDPAAIDGMVPAWTPGQAGVTLPVFYHWSFYTEEEGDFESLVRRLVPRMLPKEVGIRDMDVSDPRGGLTGIPAHAAPLGLEGALKTVRTETTPWPSSAVKTLFIDRLRRLVNAPAEMLAGTTADRLVAPPLYGRWHAAAEMLDLAARPTWFHELNHDPRLRTTAGLGTQVIQANQRELMASAWLQVEGIRAANEQRRHAQTARAASLVAYDRHVVPAADEDLLTLSTSLHARVMGSPVTIRTLLRDSPIPSGLLDASWRRVARPLGPLGRRQRPPATAAAPDVLGRLNRGDLKPGAAPPTPPSLPTVGGAGGVATPVPQPVPAAAGAARIALGLLLVFVVLLLVLAAAAFGALGFIIAAAAMTAGWFIIPATLRSALRALFSPPPPAVPPASESAANDLVAERFDSAVVRSIPLRPDFRLAIAPPLGFLAASPPSGTAAAVSTGGESDDARAFRAALTELFDDLGAPVPAQRPMTQVRLPVLRAKLQSAIDPRVTIARAFGGRTTISPDVGFTPRDPLEEIKAYPKFPQPMYATLRDLGQDWLLPGLELIPVNTIALLITNQRVIEAYMAGLNHEMARELRWNEYPTEQRGSFFRQFWDVRGVDVPPGDPEALLDIEEMHLWKKIPPLGANSARPPMPSGEERLVLLVRGDLFRRYPNTEVYAVEAVASDTGKRTMSTKRVDYEFHGRLNPDVVFFGFPLTPSLAKGALDATDATKPQGYFFVLQEQPAEPRFGLDAEGVFGGAVTAWDDLGWRHLSANAGEHDALTYIDLDRPLPDLQPMDTGSEPAWHADSGLGRAGAQASHLAHITLQEPVLIAVHGSDMLRDT